MKSVFSSMITLVMLMACNPASAHTAMFSHTPISNEWLHIGFHVLGIMLTGTVIFLLSRHLLRNKPRKVIKLQDKK